MPNTKPSVDKKLPEPDVTTPEVDDPVIDGTGPEPCDPPELDSRIWKCRESLAISRYDSKARLLRVFDDHDNFLYSNRMSDFVAASKLLRLATEKKFMLLLEGQNEAAHAVNEVIKELEEVADKIQSDLEDMLGKIEEKLKQWNNEEMI
jgi:hypothetical protein